MFVKHFLYSYFSEVTIKQLREKLKEFEEKLESTAQVMILYYVCFWERSACFIKSKSWRYEKLADCPKVMVIH